MKNEDFIEASAYLRILEKKLLTSDSIDRLVETNDVSDTLKLLSQSSEYNFSTLKKTSDYEEILKLEMEKFYKNMYKLIPDNTEVIDIITAKYTFHNVKVCLKSKYIDKNMDYLLSSISPVNPNDIKELVLSNDFANSQLPVYIIEAIKKAEINFAESKDPKCIDIILDKEMFSYMLELCLVCDNEFITQYVKLLIDFYNIKTLVRVKNMKKDSRFLNDCLVASGLTPLSYFLENYDKTIDVLTNLFYYKYFSDITRKGFESYNKTGNFSNLEKYFDNYLIEYSKKAKYVAFGADILFSYVLSKENELRQIRILLTCKNNGIQNDILKERLRDNYA